MTKPRGVRRTKSVLLDPKDVRDRLARIAKARREDLRLRPVLAERTVRAYERRHGVTLPDEYRHFVTMVGDGGAGPNYGLFRLRDVFEAGWLGRGDPAKPFRHRRAWNLPAAAAIVRAHGDAKRFAKAAARWTPKEERRYWSELWLDGAVPISDHGCGYLDWLVVNGPGYGTVWYDGREGHLGITPLTRDGAPVTFSDWYASWLAGATHR